MPPEHDLILEAIQELPQMKDKTLIHLSIVGSRSKQLSSHDSDYDVKAVILHSTEDYLLQKVSQSKSFETFIVDPITGNSVEVEGTLVDYLTMTNYALSTNHAAFDALFGIAVYETKESEYLKQLFERAYDPRRLLYSFQGLLRAEIKRVEKKQHHGHIKHTANMVYYASAAHAVIQSSSTPPRPDAFWLLEHIDSIDSKKLKEEIRCLYKLRMADKSISDYDTTPFLDFIKSAYDLHAYAFMKPKKSDETLREEADQAFVGICRKHF